MVAMHEVAQDDDVARVVASLEAGRVLDLARGGQGHVSP
jgi:hypothetical protein